VNLADELRQPLVQVVLAHIGDPVQPAVVATLIGFQAVGQAPAGMNGFRYADWIVAYSLRQPAKDVFVNLVRTLDPGEALVPLHALLAELEADGSRWSAPAQPLWIPPGWPFIDRASLRDVLATMAEGGGLAAVSIEGPFGEGKRTMAAYVNYLAQETNGFSPIIRELRQEPADTALFAIATDFWVALGAPIDIDTTHAEPERQATTLAQQIAFAASAAPLPIWFVATVIDHTGLAAGLLKFVDELLRLVQSAPEISRKLRVIVLCDQLPLLELRNPPPTDARFSLPQITSLEIRQWLEAAAPGKTPTLYQLAADTVMQSLDLPTLEPSSRLRRLSFGCKLAHTKL
jgi:hypothetical protein